MRRMFGELLPRLSHFDQKRPVISIWGRACFLKASRCEPVIIFLGAHVPQFPHLGAVNEKRRSFVPRKKSFEDQYQSPGFVKDRAAYLNLTALDLEYPHESHW
jgi:hypothetical protein